MDSRTCQTSPASPAEPGGLSASLDSGLTPAKHERADSARPYQRASGPLAEPLPGKKIGQAFPSVGAR